MVKESYITLSEEETINYGSKFAERLIAGDIVALYGDLGSGKTQFIKGICIHFEVEEMVTSPTFTIINQYFGKRKETEIPIYHIDLYRIKSDKELQDIGLNDFLYSKDAIVLVEWAEKAEGHLPESVYSIQISLNKNNEDERIFEISW